MEGQDLIQNCASGSDKRVPRIDATRSLLSASGFVCDTVTEYGSAEMDFELRLKQWAELALNSTYAHSTGISRVQAFFRTITADMSSYGFRRPEFKDEEAQRDFVDRAIGFMNTMGHLSVVDTHRQNPLLFEKALKWESATLGNKSYAIHLNLFLKLIPDEPVVKTDSELLRPFLESTNQCGEIQWPYDLEELTKDDENNLAIRFMDCCGLATKFKSFFITDKGYMGLSLALIQTGDKVCIIFGCPNPLLLRKTGDRYVLVGEIYVYGMMGGEIIEELEAGKFVEEEFTIE